MYAALGNFVSRHWIFVVLFWGVAAGAIGAIAPTWDEVSKDGDLAYLPDRMTSVRGQKLYGEAFPENKSRSEFVVVVERESGLVQADLNFAHKVADFFVAQKQLFNAIPETDRVARDKEIAVVDVMRPASNLEGRVNNADDLIGKKLISPDKKALIVVASLEHELIAVNSARLMRRLVGTLDARTQRYDGELQKMFEEARENEASPMPAGSRWAVTGSAAVGGDTLIESDKSIEAIHLTTGILVVIILMIVYRAPVLVVVPLLTIGVAVYVANNLIAMLTQLNTVPGFGWWEFEIFKTSKIFIFTICFGSGTDFCLFLISRYKEEMERGLDKAAALKESLGQVGEALTGSAMTTVCGLGMMYFADFGKFTYSGPAIAMCLIVTLLGCLTLAPAMLRGFGKLVFWPFGLRHIEVDPDAREIDNTFIGRFWTAASDKILARPGLIMFGSLILMAPLAYEGLDVKISYDLLSDLKDDRPSKVGTAMMQRHFQAGEMGPISILAVKDGYDFESDEGRKQITELTKEFYAAFPERITSVRSLTYPLGDRPPEKKGGLFGTLNRTTVAHHKESEAKYVAKSGPRKGTVTRFDIITAFDPFSTDAENLLGPLDPKARKAALNLEDFVQQKSDDPESFWYKSSFDFIGTTAGTRDLKASWSSPFRRWCCSFCDGP